MKIHHFALIFVVFVIAIVVVTDLKVSESDYMSRETELTNTIFDRAVVAATDNMLDSEFGVTELTKENAVTAFYNSLYASFGITDSPLSRENMALYVPVICVTEPDGFYIYYNDIVYSSTGGTELKRCWTEKKTYTYRENTAPAGYIATDFIYRFEGDGSVYVYDTQGIIKGEKGFLQRVYIDEYEQETAKYLASLSGGFSVTAADPEEFEYYDLVRCLNGPKKYYSLLSHKDELLEKEATVRAVTLEDNLNYYCNAHNFVAQQQGVLYTFSIPAFDTETYLRSSQNTSFLAFFQGYPIPGTDEVFNRYSVSNAEVEMAQVFYIDDTLTYHRTENCKYATEITDSATTQSGCAAKGAYACDECFPGLGAHRH